MGSAEDAEKREVIEKSFHVVMPYCLLFSISCISF